MSNILNLPVYRLQEGVDVSEDFAVSVDVTPASGGTFNGSGINFTLTIAAVNNNAPLLRVGGSLVANTLSFNVAAASKATLQPGAYRLGIFATDGTNTRAMLSEGSAFAHGNSSPASITTIKASK